MPMLWRWTRHCNMISINRTVGDCRVDQSARSWDYPARRRRRHGGFTLELRTWRLRVTAPPRAFPFEQAHAASQPPSSTKVEPVAKPASSESSQQIPLAISSGRPKPRLAWRVAEHSRAASGPPVCSADDRSTVDSGRSLGRLQPRRIDPTTTFGGSLEQRPSVG